MSLDYGGLVMVDMLPHTAISQKTAKIRLICSPIRRGNKSTLDINAINSG